MDSIRLVVQGGITEVRSLLRSHPMVTAAVAFVVVTGFGVHLALGLPGVRAAYETARLFFDSADTSFDDRTVGAPPLVVTLLWIDRFLAPAVVAGAVLEVVHRVTRHGAVRPWWRNHVIVVGAGSLGAALARDHLRRGQKVVVVDMDTDGPNLEGLRSLGAIVIEGDVRQRDTLSRAKVERARVLYAVTEDDIANFSAALHAARLAGHRKLTAHAKVEDPELRQRLDPLVRHRFASPAVLFDGHDVAAHDLVHGRRILKQPGRSALVIAGYGHFGQAVADAVVARHGARDDLDLWIVDPRLGPVGAQALASAPPLRATPPLQAWGTAHPGRLHLEGVDMLDATMWDRLRAATDAETHLDFAICTDNDARNVAFALAMQSYVQGHCATIQIVIRMLEWSNAEADVLPGVSVVSVKDLVLGGLAHASRAAHSA